MSAILHSTEGEKPVAYANPVILLPDEDGEEWVARVQSNRDETFSLPLYVAPQQQWQPIETAPEGVLLVVGWLDPEDAEHPERHDFDYLEDGVWQKHSENVEYFHACAPAGSRGPKEQAPYTHFMPIGSIPPSPNQGEAS